MFRRLYSDGPKSIPSSLQTNTRINRHKPSDAAENALEMSDRHVYANPSYPGHFEAPTMQIGGLPFYLPRDAASEQPHHKVRGSGLEPPDEHIRKFSLKLCEMRFISMRASIMTILLQKTFYGQ